MPENQTDISLFVGKNLVIKVDSDFEGELDKFQI